MDTYTQPDWRAGLCDLSCVPLFNVREGLAAKRFIARFLLDKAGGFAIFAEVTCRIQPED